MKEYFITKSGYFFSEKKGKCALQIPDGAEEPKNIEEIFKEERLKIGDLNNRDECYTIMSIIYGFFFRTSEVDGVLNRCPSISQDVKDLARLFHSQRCKIPENK